MSLDLALSEGSRGTIIVHRADCPTVRAMADAGFPVITLLGCERMPPDEYERHLCCDLTESSSSED